eukprot:7102874-Heterocapsa_arctica.AAC.1
MTTKKWTCFFLLSMTFSASALEILIAPSCDSINLSIGLVARKSSILCPLPDTVYRFSFVYWHLESHHRFLNDHASVAIPVRADIPCDPTVA